MAAGITVYYDRGGSQTADLINTQWPTLQGEPRPRVYQTSSGHIGTGVLCHATQSFRAPEMPAGTSKRMGAYYEKTGALQHRTEPGFRNTKQGGSLTETPIAERRTLRQPSALPGAGSMVLSTPASRQHEERPPREGNTTNRRSRSSAASSRASAGRDVSASAASAAGAAPTWTRQASAPQPWNFETLPMYQRSSETYGKGHTSMQATNKQLTRAAGKSESGFMDPAELVAKLTRPA